MYSARKNFTSHCYKDVQVSIVGHGPDRKEEPDGFLSELLPGGAKIQCKSNVMMTLRYENEKVKMSTHKHETSRTGQLTTIGRATGLTADTC